MVHKVAMWGSGVSGPCPWLGPHRRVEKQNSKWLVLGGEATTCYSPCGEPLKPLCLITGGAAIHTKRPGTCSETPCRRGQLGLTFSSCLLNTALDSQGDDTQLHFFFFHACFASFFQEAFLCPTAWQVRTDLLVPFTRDRGRDKRKKILEPMTFLNLQLFLLFQTFPSPISPYRPQCHLRMSEVQDQDSQVPIKKYLFYKKALMEPSQTLCADLPD